MTRSFASDNNAGIHPEVLARIAAVNEGHARAYGDDAVTRAAEGRLRAVFGEEAEVFFVFGGTGANVLGLSALARPYHAIFCTDSAHIQRDECGAVERFTGCKLIPIPAGASGGKLTVEGMKPWLADLGNEHHAQPRVVSITQATELGTVYTPEELGELGAFCREHGLALHMDGARLANAAAHLGVSPRAITTDVGVDVLTLGGTKNGLLGGEAVLFLSPQRVPGTASRVRSTCSDFKLIRKQGMQLASKMRFVAAQFEALFTNELWKRNAAHANAMAERLAAGLRGAGVEVEVAHPVQANAVFAWLPRAIVPELQEQAYFYVWDEAPRGDGAVLARLMASFDTISEDVDSFVEAAAAAVARLQQA